MIRLSLVFCLLLSGCDLYGGPNVSATAQKNAIAQCQKKLGLNAPAKLVTTRQGKNIFNMTTVVKVAPSGSMTAADAARINGCAANAVGMTITATQNRPRNLGCSLTLSGGSAYVCSNR